MSTEREELDGLANDIYEHSRLRSAEADGLAVTLSRLGYRNQGALGENTLLIEVRLGSEYESPNAEGSEPGGWFAYVESATVLAGNLSEGVRSLAAPYAGELDYDGFVQEAIATYIASVPVEEDEHSRLNQTPNQEN